VHSTRGASALLRFENIEFIMKEKLQSTWFKIIVLIYVIAVFFCFLSVSATAYALANTELRFREMNPFVRELIADYGLSVGLLFASLLNTFSILFLWLFFIPYLYIEKRHEKLKSVNPLVYACMSAFGLSQVTVYLLNAVNDVSVVLFGHSPVDITFLIDWGALIAALMTILLVVPLLAVYYIYEKWQKRKMEGSKHDVDYSPEKLRTIYKKANIEVLHQNPRLLSLAPFFENSSFVRREHLLDLFG
jgi:magnesium-transporting ATPase (P-type)